jgi:hypothetical protein
MMRGASTAARALLTGGVGAGVASMLFLLHRYDPAAGGLFPPCLLSWATGWSCPGCGGLRGMHALLHGDVAAAWALNPLLLTLVPLLCAWGLWQAAVWLGAPLRAPRMPPMVAWLIVAGVAVFGVCRNL